MMLAQVEETAPTAMMPAPLIEGLIDTLKSERKLLDDLRAIMIRQRDAVSGDDLQGLDDSVFAVQRVLLTLSEARKRRRTLSERLGCDVDTPPRHLADALGHQGTDTVRLASQALEDAARELAREVAMNREVLRKGLAAGEEFVRMLTGSSVAKVGYPEKDEAPSMVRGSFLVNRQA
jgi:hypothetical protein